MKVCIPTMGDKGMDELVGEHFGRVPTYTTVDTETNEVNVVNNTSQHMGGQGYPTELIAKLGVEAMLCGNLGRRAISMYKDFGIMVYVGASGTVRDALQSFKDGQLQAATDENACRQRTYHDRDHL